MLCLEVGVADDGGAGIEKQGTPNVSEISRQRMIHVQVILTMLKIYGRKSTNHTVHYQTIGSMVTQMKWHLYQSASYIHVGCN